MIKNQEIFSERSLFKNSLWLILSLLSSNIFGFFFWALSARLYAKEDVGVATVLFSSIMLIVAISRLGLDQSLIKYFFISNKNQTFFTTLMFTSLAAIIIGVLFIGFSGSLSLEIQNNKIFCLCFLVLLTSYSVLTLSGTLFVVSKRGEYYFMQSLIIGSRIIFLVPLLHAGSLGIIASFGIAFTIGLFQTILSLYKIGIKFEGFDIGFVKKSFKFSAGNYIIGIFMLAPSLILPIIILNLLGKEDAATYYIDYSIASTLFIIPSAFSTSLFIEGSIGKNIEKILLQSIIGVSLLLSPMVLILILYSDSLLALINLKYIDGAPLLKVFALSSFFVAICQLYYSIKQIEGDIKDMMYISALIFISSVGLSCLFITQFGILGIGYAWVIAYGLSSLLCAKGLLKIRKKPA